jgi:hypothetical protein
MGNMCIPESIESITSRLLIAAMLLEFSRHIDDFFIAASESRISISFVPPPKAEWYWLYLKPIDRSLPALDLKDTL